MSGVTKAVGKVFKKVKEVVSDVVETVKENDILRTAAVAGLVWFAAGTASAYFAAPEAGLGTAMSTSASNMYTTTASFFGGGPAAPGVESVATGAQPTALEATAAGAKPTALTQTPGISSAELASEQAFLNAGGYEAGAGVAEAAQQGSEALRMAEAAGTAAGDLNTVTGGDGVLSGAMNFMRENPMLTYMLGSGVESVVTADAAAEQQEKEWNRRGLFGVTQSGQNMNAEPAGPAVGGMTSGVINASRRQAAPMIAEQERQQVALPRSELLRAKRSGQIA